MWDQRIPNEAIFDRIFATGPHPPIIPQVTNQSTRGRGSGPVPGPSQLLLMDDNTEREMMLYWYHTVKGKGKGKGEGELNLAEMVRKYPKRPWLQGIHKNIDRESQLIRRGYNPKDCISQEAQEAVDRSNKIADRTMLREMTKGQIFRNGTLCEERMWNQPTSLKN
jgi:hypothetical protein